MIQIDRPGNWPINNKKEIANEINSKELYNKKH